MNDKRIKSPVTKGVAKVPVVMQMEALECGAASLCMILAYYGKWVPLEQVRADCGVSRDGSSAKNVLRAARSYGLEAKGYRFEPQELRDEGRFPCIVHWEFNHFVVLDGFRGGRAYLNDPARGAYSVSMERFDEAFTGVALMMEPTEAFEPGGRPKSVLAFARSRLRGARSAMAFVAAAWIQAVYSLRLNGKMAAVGSSTYMWKVLRLPMEFFSQRMAGDIQARQSANATIASGLVNIVAPLLLNTAMAIFYLVVMVRYSWVLTLVGMTALLVNVALSRLISNKRVNITRVMMRDSGKLVGATVGAVDMIETIKASGAENGYFEKWAGYQASVNTQTVRFERLNQYLGVVPQAVSGVMNILVLVLGVWLTMQGQFTVGMIFAFQGFMSAFMTPANQVLSAGQQIQEMRSGMERIQDVMAYPEDSAFAGRPEAEEYGRRRRNTTSSRAA